MKALFVADERVDFRIVKALRLYGAEVFAICEEQPSINDQEVLHIAVSKNAVLITEDKDFGELVFRLRLPHKGVILGRMKDVNFKIENVAAAIYQNFELLHNRFSVINERRLRIKE
ncbi:hypothetical protein A8C56_22595 [Niabella ginsenosidivorans]|uniref:DUF5615 domain-containing protein n=1 Tax=Niabella ginsenosidivorans TaxID=1176587 RepID=A0A1A9I8K3_9BACT|nr:DUF5615 family PIN-like protein [Niabella ginsenosidivorans]ANH83399.1 hypothetical protein A8C56_22595 [Niabella ginsenosidivorans]